jgi:very-short-patch-repair endonuclease
MKDINSSLRRLFREQHGVVHRQQVLHLGMTARQIQNRLTTGEWQQVHRGVYRSSTAAPTFEQSLMAACLAAGPTAVASHESAAWLWQLLPKPPDRPTLTVAPRVHPHLTGVEIHRLTDRGIIGAPHPSVLEQEALQLLRRWRVPIHGREVKAGPDDRYRIDFLLVPPVAMEVDGYTHHWSPEAKAYDEARRNQLRIDGLFLLIYTWLDVRSDQRRMHDEVTTAIARYGRG